jgi:DNA-directed RNA polymerase subunit M/transcription elongation factor TFIIS
MRLGKRKFYCLEDMEKILREVVKTGKSVFEVCKLPVDPKDQRPIRHDTVHLHSNESQPTPAEKIRAEGIKCPSCGTVEEYVSKTNIRRDNSMYRTKECKRCGERFATLEVPLGVIHVKRRNRKKKQKEQRIITG